MDFEMYFTIKRNHILIPDLEKSNLSKITSMYDS